MRTAIWRWIETKPHQFAKICASDNRSLAGSEVLFDLCTGAAESSRKKAILWPLQTILLTLSPDILLQAFLDDRGVQNRRVCWNKLKMEKYIYLYLYKKKGGANLFISLSFLDGISTTIKKSATICSHSRNSNNVLC
jgi:hypothetical protein